MAPRRKPRAKAQAGRKPRVAQAINAQAVKAEKMRVLRSLADPTASPEPYCEAVLARGGFYVDYIEKKARGKIAGLFNSAASKAASVAKSVAPPSPDEDEDESDESESDEEAGDEETNDDPPTEADTFTVPPDED